MRCFFLIVLVAILALIPAVGRAQTQDSTSKSILVTPPPPRVDRPAPLYLQADELIYAANNSRVVARGNVEIYYNNFVLTADEVVYDQSTNKLTAKGNAQLKDPNGSITRADTFEALDDFRDAFVQSLGSELTTVRGIAR